MVVPKNEDETKKGLDAAETPHAEDMLSVRGSGNPLDDMKEAADAAGKTVVAAALAGAVATGAASVTPDQIHLPEPTPIVQTVDQPVDLPDQTVDDHSEKKASAWKSIFKILKYAILALLFAALFIFGVMGGFAGCASQCAAPIMQGSSSSAEASVSADSSVAADEAASASEDAAQESSAASEDTATSAESSKAA